MARIFRKARFVAVIIALAIIISLAAIPVQAASVTGEKVVQIAQSLKNKVTYARTYDPANYKFDCSGFTYYVFKLAGLDIRTTDDDYQVRLGTPVSKANLKAGDLVFFNSNKSDPNDVTHVGIYMGNGKVIHNTSSAGGVIITNMNTSNYMKNDYKTARRVIGVPLINVPKMEKPM
ncbi:MAG: C40 family peptidase [Bacillota bacterium]|nr:C40 family peptidase [Bacillota bacterium]HOB92418.1 C40 family peptidase [Bacillota bacterium]HPZ55582.1 C40 family peptidase [Bacillota bacterium]HQD19131.1 C40 family peptidase [Bacillota bacterium]